MKLLLLSASALMLLAGGAAFAQTASDAASMRGSGSSSISNSNAISSTRSASRAAAVGNSTTVNISGLSTSDTTGLPTSGASTASTATTGATSSGTSGTTASTGSDPNVHYSGSYTVRNTPEVIPPNVMGGNTCAVGASGGLALAGFGIAGGGTWADRACERRQQAALLFNMGEQKAAIELMCQSNDVREAMKLSGKPCTGDMAAAIAAPAAPVAQQAIASAVQVAAAPAAAAVIPAVAAKPATPKPEWCRYAAPSTEPSILYVKKVCGG